MKLRILYFAQLKEDAGRPEEQLDTSLGTPAQVYRELTGRYGFQLEVANLRAAVNDHFVSMDHPLQEGDQLAFIPPVSGG